MIKRAALSPALLLGLAAVALAPLPAMASERVAGERASQDRRPAASKLGEMSARLADPAFQGSLAAMLTALSDALLDIKVAPLAKAAEAMGDRNLSRRIGPDTTLRDMAGRDAGRMQRDLGEKLPQAMTVMAGMSGAVEAMLPQLEAAARRMGNIALPRPGSAEDREPAED